MKNLLLILAVALLICSNFWAQEKDENTDSAGKFIVIVKGFETDEGKAMIALFNSENSYSETGEKYQFVAAEIKDSTAEWIIENLPFGEYAIKLYHDENGNMEMDRNMLGIPSEDYAFSNNATGSFGPADYEDAKFQFTSSGQKHVINMN